jgi:hypothetical protein
VVGGGQPEEHGDGDADADVNESLGLGGRRAGRSRRNVEVTVMAKSLASATTAIAWSRGRTTSPRFHRHRSARRSVVTPDATDPEPPSDSGVSTT